MLRFLLATLAGIILSALLRKAAKSYSPESSSEQWLRSIISQSKISTAHRPDSQSFSFTSLLLFQRNFSYPTDQKLAFTLLSLCMALLLMFLWELESDPTLFLCLVIYSATLILLSMIDIRYSLLPDALTFLLLWTGFIFNDLSAALLLRDCLYGALAGYLSLWSINKAYWLNFGKEGIGYGDMKLLSALGAWCGWQQLIWITFLSSTGGLLFVLFRYRKDIQVFRKRYIPFGPFLALAGWIVFIFRYQL